MIGHHKNEQIIILSSNYVNIIYFLKMINTSGFDADIS